MGNDGQETTIDLAAVREAVLRWAADHRRPVAVRERPDPYAVLVAELMAQQTQIERVAEAWGRFLAAFPSPEALARARPADVLRAWGNLGYNRRALVLLRSARAIVAEHAGVVPADPATLERSSGVGPYTARAVAAIACGRPVGPVDTNVRRVRGRLVASRVERRGRRCRSSPTPSPQGSRTQRPGRTPSWISGRPSAGACRSATPVRSLHGAPTPGARRRGPVARRRGLAADRRRPAGFVRRRGDQGARSRGKADGSTRPESGTVGRPRGHGDRGPVGQVSPDRLPFPATRRWLRGRIVAT